MVDTHKQIGGPSDAKTGVKKDVKTQENARNEIRSKIKQQRKALELSALESAGANLLTNCIQFINRANSIAGYRAMMGEIPLHPIFDYCHKNNIVTLLPIMREKSLMFAPFDVTTTFNIRQYGIQEPDVSEAYWLTPEQLDVVLVPLVAFDTTCNRIGMGGGFYDRSFEFRKKGSAPPTLVGVAHALQQVDNVYAQHWDVALDFVATNAGVLTNTTDYTNSENSTSSKRRGS